MAKFSQIAKGTRALKPVEFTLLDGETKATCLMRPLLGQDDALVLAEARAFAVSRGVADPKDRDPLYELGRAVAILVHACCDVDAHDQPFFESATEILAHLDRERIFLLSEKQALHQEDCAPHRGKIGVEEYIADVYKIASAAEGEDLPFASWPRSKLESCLVFSAKLLASLLEPKSPTGSVSDESSSATNSAPPPELNS